MHKLCAKMRVILGLSDERVEEKLWKVTGREGPSLMWIT
jgi:hypothetical protein